MCPHDKCPYHQLDNCKTYDEYLNKNGGDSVSAILSSLGKN